MPSPCWGKGVPGSRCQPSPQGKGPRGSQCCARTPLCGKGVGGPGVRSLPQGRGSGDPGGPGAEPPCTTGRQEAPGGEQGGPGVGCSGVPVQRPLRGRGVRGCWGGAAGRGVRVEPPEQPSSSRGCGSSGSTQPCHPRGAPQGPRRGRDPRTAPTSHPTPPGAAPAPRGSSRGMRAAPARGEPDRILLPGSSHPSHSPARPVLDLNPTGIHLSPPRPALGFPQSCPSRCHRGSLPRGAGGHLACGAVGVNSFGFYLFLFFSSTSVSPFPLPPTPLGLLLEFPPSPFPPFLTPTGSSGSF